MGRCAGWFGGRAMLVADAGGAVAAGVALSGCAASGTDEADGPTWSSADAAMAEADGVVRLSITGQIGRFDDGVEMVTFETTVLDRYGAAEVPEAIPLTYHAEANADYGIEQLEIGDELIVAYRHDRDLSVEVGGGTYPLYVPVGSSYGLFDVHADGTVTPQGQQITGLIGDAGDLEVGTAEPEDPPPWPLAEVEALARSANSSADGPPGEPSG